ncbi:MAG: YetF domain-containing protein [Maribacter sp.]
MDLFDTLSLITMAKMLFAAICIYLYIILITRLAGKRTFAKMTSLDFAVTIAMGSILADAVNKPVSNLFPALMSLALLAGLQVLFSKILSKSNSAQKILTNTPILLMKDGQIFEENLKKALVSKADLMGKLREANVLQLSQVKAVIFETTGDVSVLHTTDNIEIDTIIMGDVASFG